MVIILSEEESQFFDGTRTANLVLTEMAIDRNLTSRYLTVKGRIENMSMDNMLKDFVNAEAESIMQEKKDKAKAAATEREKWTAVLKKLMR